jgi:hypothetical protein
VTAQLQLINIIIIIIIIILTAQLQLINIIIIIILTAQLQLINIIIILSSNKTNVKLIIYDTRKCEASVNKQHSSTVSSYTQYWVSGEKSVSWETFNRKGL